MYRISLKTVRFQVLLILTFCMAGDFILRKDAAADSTEITTDIDSVAALLSSSALNGTRPDEHDTSAADSGFSDSTEASGKWTDTAESEPAGTLLREDSIEEEQPLQSRLQIESRGSRKQLFITFASRLRAVIAEKVSRPFPGSRWIIKQRNKLMLLAGSLIIIFCTIGYYRQRREQGRFMTTTRLSIMDKVVQKACRFIEENYSETELDATMICNELVTGKAFLEALFVKELGLTIDDFIVQVRINRAKIELRKRPQSTAEELASTNGFTGKDNFLRCFASVTGTDFTAYQSALSASGAGSSTHDTHDT